MTRFLARRFALGVALSLACSSVALAAVLPSGATNAAGTHFDTAPVAQLTWPSTDGSVTITTGGTAQALFGGTVPSNGFKVAFPSATSGSVCWVSDTTTTPSATTPGSYPLYEQGQWSTEVGEKPAGPVYITCPLTGTVISAKRW